MVRSNETLDITELLFPSDEGPSLDNLLREELHLKASREAVKIVGPHSPIRLSQKIKELYVSYLSQAGLTYDEERGL